MAGNAKKGYIARIGADVSGFEAAIGAATNSMSTFNKMLGNLSKSIDIDPTNIDVIGTQFVKCSEQADVFIKAMDMMKSGYSDFVRKLDSQDASGDLSKKFTEDFNKISALVAKYNELSADVKPLVFSQGDDGLDKFNNAVIKQNEILEQQRERVEGLRSEYEALKKTKEQAEVNASDEVKNAYVDSVISPITEQYAGSGSKSREDLFIDSSQMVAADIAKSSIDAILNNLSNMWQTTIDAYGSIDDFLNDIDISDMSEGESLSIEALSNAKWVSDNISTALKSGDMSAVGNSLADYKPLLDNYLKSNEFAEYTPTDLLTGSMGVDEALAAFEKLKEAREDFEAVDFGSLFEGFKDFDVDTELVEQLSSAQENITAFCTSAEEGLNSATDAFNNFISENGDIDALNTELNGINSQIQALSDTADSVKFEPVEPAVNSWGKLTEKMAEADKASEETQQELERVNAALKLDPKNPELLAQKMKLIGKSSEDANEKLKLLASEQDNMTHALEIGDISQDEYALYEQAIEDCREEIRSLNSEQQNLSETVEEAGLTWKDVFKADLLADFIKNGVQSAIDKTKELASEALEVGKSFDTAMSQAAGTFAVTKGSEDYNKLKAYAQEVGATTKYTATEAAEALNYYALAGYDANEAIAALPATLKLAQAGAMDFASSTDMLTDAYTALGGITSLEDMVDEMTVASQKSNTNIEQLGQAMLTVGATARGLSGGTAELSTMLGILADNGLKGEEGGTKLRNAILSLVKPTNDASEVLDELGVSLYDDTGKMLELPEVFLSLNEALAGFTQEQRDKSVAAIFNTRDLGAVNALLGTTAERYEELETQIINSAGAADALVDVQTDNLESALKMVTSAKEALMYSIYDKFSEGLQDIALHGADALSSVKDMLNDKDISKYVDRLTDAVDKLIDKITAKLENGGIDSILDSLDLVLSIFSELIDISDFLASAVKTVGAAFLTWKVKELITNAVSLAQKFGTLAQSTLAAAQSQEGLNAAQKANVFGLIASVAVSAAIAITEYMNAVSDATTALVTHNSEVEESYLKISETIKSMEDSKQALEDNNEAVDRNIARIKDRWNVLKGMVDENGNLLTEESKVSGVLLELNTLMGSNIQLINGQIQGYKDLTGSMDGYIENLRAEARLSYMRESYEEAVGTIDDEKQTSYDYAHTYENSYLASKNYHHDYDPFTDAVDEDKKVSRRSDEWKAFEAKYADVVTFDNADYASYLMMMNGGDIDDARNAVGHDTYAAFLDYQTQMAENAMVSQKRVVSELEDTMNEYEQTIYDLGKKKTDIDKAFADAAGVTTDSTEAAYDDGSGDDAGSGIADQLKAEMTNLDDLLAIHELNEDEYYEKRAETLNKYKNEVFAAGNDEAGMALKKEWWGYQDELTDYFEKEAKSEADDAAKLAKEALTELEKGVKENILKLENERDEFEDDDKDDEWYAKELEKIVKTLEGTEIYDTYNKMLLAAQKKVKDANDKASKEEIDAWGKRSEATVKAVKDSYSKVQEAYSKAQQELSSGLKISEKFTDAKTGKDRWQITDFEAEGKRMDAYNKNLEKLKATGISDEFYNEILSMDFDSGEREGTIKELLSMSDKKRNEVYADYDKYIEKRNKASATQIGTDLDEVNKAAVEGVKSIYADMPQTAYEQGVETADAYFQGIRDTMVDVNGAFAAMGVDTAINVKAGGTSEQTQQTQQAGSNSETVNYGDTPIVINIAGEQYINKTVKELFNMNTLTGGNNLGI